MASITKVVINYFRALSKECRVTLTWSDGTEMVYEGRTHEVFEYIQEFRAHNAVVKYPAEV